jgi:hypothetical protein
MEGPVGDLFVPLGIEFEHLGPALGHRLPLGLRNGGCRGFLTDSGIRLATIVQLPTSVGATGNLVSTGAEDYTLGREPNPKENRPWAGVPCRTTERWYARPHENIADSPTPDRVIMTEAEIATFNARTREADATVVNRVAVTPADLGGLLDRVNTIRVLDAQPAPNGRE